MAPFGERARIAGLMSFLPYSVLWMALAIAAILSIALHSRSRLSTLLPVVMVMLAGALWIWARPPAADSLAEGSILAYGWRIGPATWQLTGMVLAVLLTATLSSLTTNAPEHALPAAPGSLLLGTSLLPFIWAGDSRSAVLFLALFSVIWVAVWWWSDSGTGRGDVRAGLLIVPLLLIWFADAVALSGSGSAVWVELAGAAIVVAGAGLLGVWPLAGWRARVMADSLPAAVALGGLPVIAGAAVLLPITQQASLGSLQIATGVVLGLMSVLLSFRWAGRLVDLQPKGIAGLATALAGVMLLAAVFASSSALLAATRVAVFAPLTLLTIGAARALGRAGWLRVGGVAVVWLAVVGVPLTAGFTALSGLYGAWQPGPQLLLMAILGLLLVGWSAVLSTAALRLVRTVRNGEPTTPARWLAIVPAVAPLVVLLAIDPASVRAASVITWVALAVPLVAGPVLAGLLDGRLDLRALNDVTLAPPTGLTRVVAFAASGRRVVADALSEALSILEGPSGWLWILGIVVLLLLVR